MLIEEAERITSRPASTVRDMPRESSSTPVARPSAITTRVARPETIADVAALQRRPEVGVGGGPAAALPDRLLHRAEALLLLAVVVVGELEAGLGAGLDEGVVERVAAGAAGDVQRAVGAAPVGVAAVPVLHADEVGGDVGPGPAVGAHLGPVVEVERMAADVDHAVDRGGAAEDLAARRRQRPAAEVGLRLGAKAPVVAGHVHRVGERGRHLDERAPVGAAVLDDDDRMPGLAEAVGQRRAGGAGADDDVVGLHSERRGLEARRS